MTKRSNFLIVPPLEDPKAAFHKKKDKKVEDPSSKFQTDKFESFEKTPDKKGIEYKPETKNDSDEEEV